MDSHHYLGFMCNIYTRQKQLSFPGEKGSSEFMESTNGIEWFDTKLKEKIIFKLNWGETIEGQIEITQFGIGPMQLALVQLLLQMEPWDFTDK